MCELQRPNTVCSRNNLEVTFHMHCGVDASGECTQIVHAYISTTCQACVNIAQQYDMMLNFAGVEKCFNAYLAVTPIPLHF